MTDLAEFLLARIAEDDETARQATPGIWKLWGMSVMADPKATSRLDDCLPVAETQHEAGMRTWNAMHIARWDPVRVLADCAAKRLIIEDYRAALNAHRTGWDIRSPRDYPLRALALPYADHPDYREEWRP